MNLKIAVAIAVVGLVSSCSNREKEYVKFGGLAQGTTYSIVYHDAKLVNLQPQIDSILNNFDLSLSIYNPKSIISRINRNDTSVKVDRYFTECYGYSAEVSKATNGAFDITVGPLVRAWGFGLSKKEQITPARIDSLRRLVGMEKIKLVGDRLVKSDPKIFIDVNAIAQGYSVDVVARYLESRGIVDYLVEIGGETYAKGVNAKGKVWIIGIDKPYDGNDAPGQELQAKVELPSGRALATSGSYRKFFVENSVKYSHEIDPKLGYPAKNTLLSASVVASSCAYADAYATAFMVMGVDRTKAYLKSHTQLEAYLVFSGRNGEFETYATPNFTKMMVK